MFYIWLAIIILLAIAEAMTINLVTIWYVASGIVALILSFFIDNFTIQFAVFTLLGTFLLPQDNFYKLFSILKMLKPI